MLHEFLTSNRAEILVRARMCIGGRRSLAATDLAVTDWLPLFLDHLGEALVLAAGGGTVTRDSVAQSIAHDAAAIGRRGLTQEEAINDYGDLCRALSDLAIEREEPILIEEFVTLDVVLDDAIARASAESSRGGQRGAVGFRFDRPMALSAVSSPELVRETATENRAHTDASLGAERASTDADTDRMGPTAQHVLDDRLDRDRVIGDERRTSFREGADRRLAQARSKSPARDSEVGRERSAADNSKQAEREVTDALLDQERHGADALVETERREHDAHQVRHEARRHDTDEQLSMERGVADATATALAETRTALAHNQTLDLAERKRAEKALQETERQLRQALKMEAIGRLAGGIAHDFNNVLSVILSYGDMLLSDLKPGEPMREDIDEIRKAAMRAADLTRQLLMFSRQQVMEPKVVDLNDLLVGMGRMLQRILGAGIRLVSLPTEPLGRVRLDPGSMEQVVMNLVVNARDAMPRGGKLILETANVVLDEAYARGHLGMKTGPHVMFSVTDTGVGMDKETQAHIFEPFFTTKGVGEGTGLGLSTVFGIVQQSGGSVWVDSEPGNGTSFRVYLPRVDAAVDLVRSTTIAPTTLRGTETILLVEDDDQVRAVAVAILRRAGYRVIETRNAGEALMQSEGEVGVIHLLLTDVVMPHVSGPQLAKRLATARPAMKLLCMSGYTDDNVVRRGVLEAHIAYLQKPLTPDTLTTKVREVLNAPTP
jgi:signal transduction histidine kinase